MSDRLSLGPVQVTGLSLVEINDAFRQLQDRMDGIHGLRGRTVIYDRAGVSDPTTDPDAVNLGSLTSQVSGLFATSAPPEVADASAAGTNTTSLARADHTHKGVSITGTQTVTGAKTFTGNVTLDQSALLRYKDTNGQLLHSFGTIT